MRSAIMMLGLIAAGPAQAGLESLFDTTAHDFGMVPHGSVQIHRFVLTNTTSSTLRISSYHSSCKCATPKVENKTAAPGEQLVVQVEYNTRIFTGPRSMTISVSFDQPRLETVHLRVSGYSRQDVVFNPSQIAFGIVPFGKGAQSQVKVEYAGGADFRINEVVPPEGVDASVKELYRESRKAGYLVTVNLPESAPVGEVFSAIQLKTNDPKSPIMTVPVTGSIEANLTAAPGKLELGQVKMGDKLVKKVILKAKEPFTLEKVTGQADGVLVKSTEGARTAHILEIEYSPTKPGIVAQEILLNTSLPNEQPLGLVISASVVDN
jgi:hypothetical protein